MKKKLNHKSSTRAKAEMPASRYYGSARVNGNPELLKGSMLPRSVSEVSILVTNVRPAPDEWAAPVIIDFKWTGMVTRSDVFRASSAWKARSWTVNATNGQLLRRYLTADDLQELEGATISLAVKMKRDPNKDCLVRALEVAAVRMPATTSFVDVESAEEEESGEDDYYGSDGSEDMPF